MAHQLKIVNGPSLRQLLASLTGEELVTFFTNKVGADTTNSLRIVATISSISKTSHSNFWLVTATTELHKLHHQRLLNDQSGTSRVLRGLYDPHVRKGEITALAPTEALELNQNPRRESRKITVEIQVPDSELGICVDLIERISFTN